MKRGKKICSGFKEIKLLSEDFKSNKIFLERNHVFEIDHINRQTHIFLTNRNELKAPKKNEQLRIRTQQRFNLLVILLMLIDNKKADEITIASYTFNREAFITLIQMVENGKIGKLNLLLAPFFKIRQKKYYEEMKRVCRETKNVHLTFAHSHLKITLIKEGDNYYQFEGSMNYSGNQMAEQLLLENNKSIYDFDHNFLKNILSQRKNKSLEFVC